MSEPRPSSGPAHGDKRDAAESTDGGRRAPDSLGFAQRRLGEGESSERESPKAWLAAESAPPLRVGERGRARHGDSSTSSLGVGKSKT